MTDEELKDLVAMLVQNAERDRQNAERARAEDRERLERERAEERERTERTERERAEERERERIIREQARAEERERERIIREQARAEEREREQARERERIIREQARERERKEMNRQIGDMHRKWGTFTEGLLMPSIEEVLESHFGMTTISTRLRVRKGGDEMELDAFGYANGNINTAVIVEVKSHLDNASIKQVTRMTSEFAKFFPEHADKKLYVIVAAIDAPKHLRNELRKAGIYFAATDDNMLDLKIEENFTPKDFNHL
jgi:flagellar biosynthesis GTPase FlhF